MAGEMTRGSKVALSAIIAAIWVGVFGFSAFAEQTESDDLTGLLTLALVIGAVLTIAAMVFTLAVSKCLRHTSTKTTERYYARIRSESAFSHLRQLWEAPVAETQKR